MTDGQTDNDLDKKCDRCLGKWIEATKKQMNSDETGKHKSRRETKERTIKIKIDYEKIS